MKVEFKVLSDHLSWDDPAIDAAMDEYTSSFWPFGRREKAQEKLEEKQQEVLERNGVEQNSRLGMTVLEVKDAESEEKAQEKINSFKEDLEILYREEFDLDEPVEITMRDRLTV